MRIGTVAAVLGLVTALPTQAQEVVGARTPAVAADGRVVVAVAGDLWLLPSSTSAAAVQLTNGPEWDRDPAWAPDGSIVFASDREGATVHLWRIEAVPSAQAQRLTRGVEHDVEPSVAGDGTIVFARGLGGDADLWLLLPDGGAARLTTEPGAEREPSWSPDGLRIAYVAVRDGRRELRVRPRGEGAEQTLLPDRSVRSPTWSPDGRRLAFGTEGREPGVWVAGADGRYAQPLSQEAGVPAWLPDGSALLVAAMDPGDGGYNGDPDRLGERRAGDMFRLTGALQRIDVPGWPAAQDVAASVESPRRTRNAVAYNRVWTRVARLYYDEGSTEWLRWRDVGEQHRAAAMAAQTDEELEEAAWRAVRERPTRAVARGRAGVSSAHPLASAAGTEILGIGGNVVDAAVAVSFALGVVEPDASGIGGYGEMLIQLDGMSEPAALEFMATVPAAAAIGAIDADALPRAGAGVANVPGTVAGMEKAWRTHGSGRIPWARLLEPAIRLAEEGFPISDGFATTLRREHASFAQHAGSRALFFRDDVPLAAGDTLRNPDLAWTLREVARDGAAALYRGNVAQRVVNDRRAKGSLMTLDDLVRYEAKERRAVRTSYRGNDVFSGPPPVTGGATLAARLNLLERAPRGGSFVEDAAKLHAMIEATKLVPSTNGRIHDPDIWPIDVTPFESKDTAAMRWRCFSPDSVIRSAARCGAADSATTRNDERVSVAHDECLAVDRECRGTGTTAFVVADANGNIVSVTQTLGTWGGNFYVSPGLGFLYNDKLRSYGSNPNAPNARAAGARHTTTITPTIVFRGSGAQRRPWFGVGAAGNAWIGSAVYAAVVGIIDDGLNVQQALELPRFLGTTRVQIEDGFSPAAIRGLESMGHVFDRISLSGELRMGYGAAVMVTDGHVEAAGDPRRSGTGMAVR